MSARCSFDTEPWWARARIGASSTTAVAGLRGHARAADHLRRELLGTRRRSASRRRARSSPPVSRSASRREFANTIVDRCCSTSSTIAWSTCGQIDPALCSPVSSASPNPGATGSVRAHAELGHVLDRHDDAQVERLLGGRLHDLDRGASAEEPRHLVDRTHRRRQADALRRGLEHRIQPLERHRQVRAALGRRHRVDLVDDHGLDAREGLARRAGQHQVQRLGRRDQDVGGLALQQPPVAARRVTRAHAHRDDGHLGARAACAVCVMPTSGERRLRSTSTPSALSGEM